MKQYRLAVYDVRSIQKYIYATSKMKEIVGASAIVRDFLTKTIANVASKNNWSYKDNWKNEEHFSLSDEDIIIMAEGGGNLFALVDETIVKELNRAIGKEFLVKTAALSVAYAYSDSYVSSENISNARYLELRIEAKKNLSDVERRMHRVTSTNALPITFNDPFTGNPFSSFEMDEASRTEKWFTKESSLKLKAYREEKKHYKKNESFVFELDDLTEKGNDSFVAVVHIDGNNIGATISNYLKNNKKNTFEDEVDLSRAISKSIIDGFNGTLVNILDSADIQYRIIVNSGDDMTFIVKGEYALSVVDKYLKEIVKCGLPGDSKDNHFTACAGIAFVKSHFPFDKAYEIAESCCESAKVVAKKNSPILCALDYYFCHSGFIAIDDKSPLSYKPYIASDDAGIPNSTASLFDKVNVLKKSLARSAWKHIRNSYEKSEGETMLSFALANAKVKGKELEPFDSCHKGVYYDATVIADKCTIIDFDEEGK